MSTAEKAAEFFGVSVKSWAKVPTWHSMWNFERGMWFRDGAREHGNVCSGEIQCGR